jgi:hypothetical protein
MNGDDPDLRVILEPDGARVVFGKYETAHGVPEAGSARVEFRAGNGGPLLRFLLTGKPN